MFSPYYAWARRGGRRADPQDHCAFNIALYGARGARWAMTERGARSLARDDDALAIGRSSISYDGDALLLRLDEICAPLPRRLRGSARIRFPGLETSAYTLDAAGLHVWRPLAPRARIEVELASPDLRWSGACYVDCNHGARPLEDDFTSWNWSRAHLRTGSAIVYEARRRDGETTLLALRHGAGGVETFAPPPLTTLERTRWRLNGATRADAGSTPKLLQRLEDAPFYARSVLGLRLLGEDTIAVHESLSLDRFKATATQLMLPFRMPRRA